MSRQIFQLRIALVDVSPAIWRRVAVPGGYTLDRVHRVIQYAMGWQDCHLHSIEADGIQYGVPDPAGGLDLRGERRPPLDALCCKDSALRSVYNFAARWGPVLRRVTLFPAG